VFQAFPLFVCCVLLPLIWCVTLRIHKVRICHTVCVNLLNVEHGRPGSRWVASLRVNCNLKAESLLAHNLHLRQRRDKDDGENKGP
jgi:hypothetical protein